MKMKIIILSIFGLCFFLSAGLFLETSYKGKKVHLSFDDVSICMKELVRDSVKYNSIFEQPFLADIKELHESSGAKFTLYIYEQDGDYDIEQLPVKYLREFSQCSEWLKIGYHAKNPTISKDSIMLEEVFLPSFNRVDRILSTNANAAKSTTLRLHYFFATWNEVQYLKSKGIQTLLSADDDRISYSLSCQLNKYLIDNEALDWGG